MIRCVCLYVCMFVLVLVDLGIIELGVEQEVQLSTIIER